MVNSPRDCSLLQHLPDYNTWVKISIKSACCAGIAAYESRTVSDSERVEPKPATGLKLVKFHVVVNGVVGVRNQTVKPPAAFSLVSCFKRRPVSVFGATPTKDSSEPQFGVRFDGHRSVGLAPSGREHRILCRAPKAFDEHHVVVFQKLVNALAQADGEHVLTVLGSQSSGHFTKDMRFLDETSGANFGPNHVAHGNNGDAGLSQHPRKFTFAGTGHAANRHHPSHDQSLMSDAQEHTPACGRETQFENSDRPHRLSINFQSRADAKIRPMEMAIMPM